MPGHDPPRGVRLVANVLVLALVGGYFAADLRFDRVRAVEYHDRKPTPGRGQDWLLAAYRRGERDDSSELAHLALVHLSPSGRHVLITLPPAAHAPGRIRGTLASAFAAKGPAGLVAEVEQATGISVERYAGIRLDDPGDPGNPGDPGGPGGHDDPATRREAAATAASGPGAEGAPVTGDPPGDLSRSLAGASPPNEAVASGPGIEVPSEDRSGTATPPNQAVAGAMASEPGTGGVPAPEVLSGVLSRSLPDASPLNQAAAGALASGRGTEGVPGTEVLSEDLPGSLPGVSRLNGANDPGPGLGARSEELSGSLPGVAGPPHGAMASGPDTGGVPVTEVPAEDLSDALPDLASLVNRAVAGAITLDEADHLHHLARLGAVLAGLGGPLPRVEVPIVRATDLPEAGPAVIWDAGRMRELADAVSADRPPPAGLVVAGTGW